MVALLHALISSAGWPAAVIAAVYFGSRSLLMLSSGIIAILAAPKGERYKLALEVLKLACRGRAGSKELE